MSPSSLSPARAADAARCLSAALAAGREAARDLQTRCGTSDPVEIARKLGVVVDEVDGDGGFGTTVVFADYMPRPPRIRLFRPAIAALDRRLADYPEPLANGTRPVFLAHELFHHWEELHPDRALRHLYRDRRLPEIAAGAFAQQLLGLQNHPELLDRLTPRPPRSSPDGSSGS
jgi:hypothetical protein